VYVLHVFQKKSKKGVRTPQSEIELVRQRLKRAATLRFFCPSGATDGAETDAKRAIPSVEVVFEGEENNRMVGCRESGGARRSAANSHHLLHARR
jgi:hypothetical protein